MMLNLFSYHLSIILDLFLFSILPVKCSIECPLTVVIGSSKYLILNSTLVGSLDHTTLLFSLVIKLLLHQRVHSNHVTKSPEKQMASRPLQVGSMENIHLPRDLTSELLKAVRFFGWGRGSCYTLMVRVDPSLTSNFIQ